MCWAGYVPIRLSFPKKRLKNCRAAAYLRSSAMRLLQQRIPCRSLPQAKDMLVKLLRPATAGKSLCRNRNRKAIPKKGGLKTSRPFLFSGSSGFNVGLSFRLKPESRFNPVCQSLLAGPIWRYTLRQKSLDFGSGPE